MEVKLLEPSWNSGVSIINLSQSEILSRGIKSLLLDVDGTLLPRKEDLINNSVKDWIKISKNYFNLHLISNNPSRNRIKNIADQVNLTYSYKASKPSRKELLNYLTKTGEGKTEVAIIGDRLFTDILAGNRVGIYTILVKPTNSDGLPYLNSKMQRIELKIASLFGAMKK